MRRGTGSRGRGNGSRRRGRNSSRGRYGSFSQNQGYSTSQSFRTSKGQDNPTFSNQSSHHFSSQSNNNSFNPSFNFSSAHQHGDRTGQINSFCHLAKKQPTTSRSFMPARTPNPSDLNSSLEENLLQILHDWFPKSVIFTEIMKTLPLIHSKKDVNRTLYTMQDNDMVRKCEECPPRWCILEKGKHLVRGKSATRSSSGSSNYQDTSNNFEVLGKSNYMQSENQMPRQEIPETSSILKHNESEDVNFSRNIDTKPNTTNLPEYSSPPTHTPDTGFSTRMSHQAALLMHAHAIKTECDSQDMYTSSPDQAHFSKNVNYTNNIINSQATCSVEEISMSDDVALNSNNKDHEDQTEEKQIEDFSDLPCLIDSESNEILDRDNVSDSITSTQSINATLQQTDVSQRMHSYSSGNTLQDKLLDILSATQTIATLEIVRKLNNEYKKLQINQALYLMEKEGLTVRSLENPPKWRLIKNNKPKETFLPLDLGSESSFHSVTNKTALSNINEKNDTLLRRRRVSSLSSTGEQSFTKESFEAPDFTSDFQFPEECIKRMDKFSISDSLINMHSTPETFVTNSQQLCSSAYQMSADDVEAYAPRCKVPRLSGASSVNDEYEELSASSKNPVSELMEHAQANRLIINFKFSMRGPDHRRRFESTVTLGTTTYPSVEGSSKKDAKNRVAASVLSILKQTQRHVSPATSPVPTLLQPVPNIFLSGNSSKNAVSLVNEYAQANSLPINFQCSTFGPDHRRSFKTILTIGNEMFDPVEASSKKDSKLKAAESALAVLRQSGKMAVSFVSGAVSETSQMKTFHDRVSMLVNEKFNELLMDLPDTMVGRKILAGFVMSRVLHSQTGDETQWDVISIGSGNRCVAGDKLSMQGDTVNDCHAEVIARRGLLRFLYKQLLAYRSDPHNKDNILTTVDDDNRLGIQDGVNFHLYISTAPCGDSALFAKSDLREGELMGVEDDDHQHRPLFENRKQGILRTKVENGEGCIPIDHDANVPTWDGLHRGERMRTMSCSDKLAKWNFLGLQGGLLSHFLQPIYMSSLTLGMLFHHGHLTRAVCCRVDKYLDLLPSTQHSPLFKVNHPQVAKVSGDDPARDTGKIKTREFSLNWIVGDETAEVLDGTVGRCEARYGCSIPVSQVSKSSLYSQFKKLTVAKFTSYAKAKAAVKDYRLAGKEMKRAFESAQCGTWMYKPAEVEDF